jgi:hypothetical protein
LYSGLKKGAKMKIKYLASWIISCTLCFAFIDILNSSFNGMMERTYFLLAFGVSSIISTMIVCTMVILRKLEAINNWQQEDEDSNL